MPINRISHLTAPTPGENPGIHRSFYRSFIQFITSNVGLIIVVIAYSIGGAFLFILLEQYIELQTCQQASLSENVTVSNLSETMYNYVAISTDNTTVMYEQIVDYLENFTNGVYDRKNNDRYTGQNCLNTTDWNFPSALLFTITVITTIGYGYVTPVSWEGQITCICYALIGIPIFLLCLANISFILGDIFRFMYSTLIHCFFCCCRIYTRSRRNHRIDNKTSFNEDGMDYVGTAPIDPCWPEANNRSNGNKLNDNEDDIDEDINDVWNRMESRVPVFAVILIIIGYISMGAFMFSHTEGWTMIISVYFCYITLATIGFGDYVPGITSPSTNGLHFLAASVYIIIGLAVLAMCFDLIKESIVDKFEWLAYKLGIISEDDDQVDKDRTQYANFEYSQQQQQQREMNEKNNDAPPAYDYGSGDGQWLKGIKDKVGSTRNFSAKQEINTEDDKY